MCGINGFNWQSKKTVQQMNKTIGHRGPDDKGTCTNKNISLGHVRLSIIDLSKKAHQPMTYTHKNQKATIVFNGEIYNYKQIRKQLLKKGYKFNSKSDTEVILASYFEYGKKCLKKLRGMFAFCIYNKKGKELFLARDRFGIKPFYYIHKKEKFSFSSEIKALLPLLNKKQIDKKALSQFFTFRFTLDNKTLVKGINKLPPAHYIIYNLKTNKKEIKKYYKLKKQNLEHKSVKYYKSRTQKLMKKSVERRMVSDVPVACLLSGGVDSSIITTLAKKHNKELNTFSIGFDTTNELPFARIIANKLKTNHREFKINKNNILDYLDRMIYHMDEPIGDPAFLPIFVLSKKVSKYNKVVLSGDGGDEVFCGYDRYKLFHYGKKLSPFLPAHFNNDILKRVKNMKNKSDYPAFLEAIRLFNNSELKKLRIEKFDASHIWKNKYKKPLTNAQEFDINTVLPNDFFMKADKMSSAFGLEQRVPFMDHELVEFAFSIPLKYKLRIWNEKYVLKQAFSKILPGKITKRRKHGFDVPIDYWFKNVLNKKLKNLLRESNHQLYNKKYVSKLLKTIKTKGRNHKMNFILAQKLWSILVFEMWYEEFVR